MILKIWVFLFSGIFAAPTPGLGVYDMILADDAVVTGKRNPLFTPADCQVPSLFNKVLVRGKLMICTYSFNFVFGGASMQTVVTTLQALGAVGVVMMVDSDSSGQQYSPIPLPIPAIVLVSYANSQAWHRLLIPTHQFLIPTS